MTTTESTTESSTTIRALQSIPSLDETSFRSDFSRDCGEKSSLQNTR